MIDRLRARVREVPISPQALELYDLLSGECRWPDADELLATIRAAVLSKSTNWIRPFRMLLGYDEPEFHLEIARRFARVHQTKHLERSLGQASGPTITIGYLSCNLAAHPVARWLAGWLALHDRSRFRTIAFDWTEAGSGGNQDILRAFDKVTDVRTISDQAVAECLRKERVDIAVDLVGYTQSSRPAILASRPCAVHIGLLGYAGTSGAAWMDYIVGDPWFTPFRFGGDYSEKIIQLPCFAYQPFSSGPLPNATRSSREAHKRSTPVVFACANHAHKITQQMFAIWMRILRQVEESVLWLWVESPVGQANLQDEAERAGVAPERLCFQPPMPYDEFLAQLARADLLLDTLPYNAHTTACDALYVGLPVLTVPGRSFHARVAAGALAAAELPALICRDLGEYERMAERLAMEPGLLQGFRERLRAQHDRLPLFDAEGFVRCLEAGYLAALDKARRGEAPGHIRIERPAVPADAERLEVAERFNQRGIEMAAVRRFVDAEALLRQAIAIYPGLAKAHNNLGNVLDELGELGEAEAAYGRALELLPGYSIARENLAALWRSRNRPA